MNIPIDCMCVGGLLGTSLGFAAAAVSWLNSKNKLQTEDMDSEEDENVKRRLCSTSASTGQVWRKHAEIRDVLDKVVPVLH